ncbi:MAG: flagellar hook-basal body complex protein, partial [Betaproteobacteria bacterium]|nr:flagellar hook-basal body complex protein [Betaproteobacteria bacterium]
KAQERMRQARPYAEKIRNVAAHLSYAQSEYKHPFLVKKDQVKNIGLIVVTSDKGLCGGLNTNVLRMSVNQMKEWESQGKKVHVSASFSNGSQKSLAKILLVNFSSPVGLRQIGDSSFLASAASGKPILGTPGSAGFGTLRAGATERANVDLTQELVDLITAQRNFQANAKAIETSSTMTSAIINLRS